MTKRLISLTLAVLMLACAFVSCGNKGDALDNTVEEASRYTSTINLWMVTDSELVQKASEMLFAGQDPDKYPEKETEQTEEHKAFLAELGEELEETWRQLDDIQDQLNVLTKKRFKTKVNLRYFVDVPGENGYYAKLEKAFRDIDAAKANGTSLYPTITEDETVTNEYGIPELKYPTAKDFQVDVLFVGGSANYYKYADKGWIAPLDELIPNAAVQLTYHLTPTLRNAVKYNGVTYAIPNNNVLGEYTYIAVDNELMEKYYISADKMGNSLYSNEMKQFLSYVAEYEGTVYPIYNESESLDLELLHYWSYAIDGAYYVQQPDTFSLFGTFYSATDVQGIKLSAENLLMSDTYKKNMVTKLQYESDGYITTNPTAAAAVRIEKGNYAKKAELEDDGYTVLKVEAPRITDEDALGAMFAVGAHTQNQSRALEIIAMINTEAEIRNLLQYGIEGVNYTLEPAKDEKGVVIGTYAQMTSDNKYLMDLAKTGNMLIAYPNAAVSDIANGKYGVKEWESAKLQNLEATIYPTTALAIKSDHYVVDDTSVRILNAVSAKMESVVNAITDPTDFTNFLAAASAAYKKNGHFGLAEWILSEDVAGAVFYRPAGATADEQVKASDLGTALQSMENVYNESAPAAKGTTQSVNVLYQKWRYDNFEPKKS